jgi:hypothetical protein
MSNSSRKAKRFRKSGFGMIPAPQRFWSAFGLSTSSHFFDDLVAGGETWTLTVDDIVYQGNLLYGGGHVSSNLVASPVYWQFDGTSGTLVPLPLSGADFNAVQSLEDEMNNFPSLPPTVSFNLAEGPGGTLGISMEWQAGDDIYIVLLDDDSHRGTTQTVELIVTGGVFTVLIDGTPAPSSTYFAP